MVIIISYEEAMAMKLVRCKYCIHWPNGHMSTGRRRCGQCRKCHGYSEVKVGEDVTSDLTSFLESFPPCTANCAEHKLPPCRNCQAAELLGRVKEGQNPKDSVESERIAL